MQNGGPGPADGEHDRAQRRKADAHAPAPADAAHKQREERARKPHCRAGGRRWPAPCARRTISARRPARPGPGTRCPPRPGRCRQAGTAARCPPGRARPAKTLRPAAPVPTPAAQRGPRASCKKPPMAQPTPYPAHEQRKGHGRLRAGKAVFLHNRALEHAPGGRDAGEQLDGRPGGEDAGGAARLVLLFCHGRQASFSARGVSDQSKVPKNPLS